LPPPGITVDLLDQVFDLLSDSQLRLLNDSPPVTAQIFPNLFFWNSHGRAADGSVSSINRIHTTVPRGPGAFELLSWALVERDAPEEVRASARRTSVSMTGISGFIEQDDAETWPALTRSARGFMGRQMTLKYGAILGDTRPEGWGGGGEVYDGFNRDDSQWHWWLRYRDFLSGKPW
jgi:hypothetical protein